jgi:hypothetical protein
MHESSEWIEIFRVADPRKPSERSVTETDADQDQLPFAFAQRASALEHQARSSTRISDKSISSAAAQKILRCMRFNNSLLVFQAYM